jgi:transposase
MANSQTRAAAKYQESKGLISKSYKLHESTIESFKKACDKNGESQAAVLTRLMNEYSKPKKNIILRIFKRHK